MSTTDRLLSFIIPVIYGNRIRLSIALGLLTLFLGWQCLQLDSDPGFYKSLPLQHPYMQTFLEYQEDFGGANLISIALINRDDDIYNKAFLNTLKSATDEVFFLPGVDRSRVRSLFTPGVRYLEITTDGISSGDVIPRGFEPTTEMLNVIRNNVAKSGVIGQLVSNDQHGAMIVAELLEFHPVTHERLDYKAFADQLENRIRGRITSPYVWTFRTRESIEEVNRGEAVFKLYRPPTFYDKYLKHWHINSLMDSRQPAVDIPAYKLAVEKSPNPHYAPAVNVHIIGFAKIIGDVSDASIEVAIFFGITLLFSAVLLLIYTASVRLTLVVLCISVIAVLWELGLLHILGFGLDPFAILVPFLVLSISISHGVQYINAWIRQVAVHKRNSYQASVETFRRLAIPGTTALITDVIGFATIYLIDIDIIQEMAINASLGMVAIIITNKIMMPIVLSYLKLPDIDRFHERQYQRNILAERLWRHLSRLTLTAPATCILCLSAVLLGLSLWQLQSVQYGDLHAGVPELRPDSRYNRDALLINTKFDMGVDVLRVVAETHPDACIDYPVMDTIDRYAWHIANTPGVHSVQSLPQVAKTIFMGWNEGSPDWYVLPRNPAALVLSIKPVSLASGLRNADCSALPVLIFTQDHKAETISRIVTETKQFKAEHDNPQLRFQLASGNVGVMAATNQLIRSSEVVILFWVYAAIIIFIFLSFRSVPALISIVCPLVLVSLMTYAFMAIMGIGLKPATLPVVALGAGIGVDDSIYLFSVINRTMKAGHNFNYAWHATLQRTGRAVIFTSIILAIGVSTWLCSGLQFQADMGLLLLFMFLANLIGAIIILPALARFMLKVPKGT